MKDLIILVGTNPLPCYISARYLWDNKDNKEVGDIYLIGSEENPSIQQYGTIDVARRLRIKLAKDLSINQEKIKILKIDDVRCIDNIVKEINKINEEHEILLNFTGGTKTMDAFFYNECEKKWKEKFSSSYLDARTNQMIINGHIDNDKDLRQIYDVTLHDLTYLHKKEVNNSEPNKIFNKALKVFDDYMNDKQKLNLWISKDQGYNSQIFKDDKGNFIKELKEEQYEILNRSIVKPVWDAISSLDVKLKDKLVFLEGVWLEYWVFEFLNQDNNGIKYYFDIKPPEGLPEFQIDICAIYGYQLTVISITTAKNKGMVKLKAFEALYRAKQLGGDETKIIQISLLNEGNNNGLIHDIEIDTGSLVSKFLCLGLEDITRDKNELRKIITEYIKK